MAKKEKVTLENYNSLNDYLFYKYMCEKGNEKQQKTFLKAIGVSIKGYLKVQNETIAPELITRKKCILDFVGETKDSLINIELQQQETNDFNDRLTYYMSKLTRLDKGNDYDLFKKIIIVSIVNFKMNELHNYKIINTLDLSDTFTEKVEIIIIELKKFRGMIKDLKNKEHLYLSFFDKMTNHKQRKEMGKMDEGLKAGVKRIEEAIQSEEELRIYHKIQLENAIAEKEKRRNEKRLKEELKKEREKGLEEEKIEIAKKLKNNGISIETIAETTGMAISRIKKL